MSLPPKERAAIIGLGLIGGSLGLALRRSGAGEVWGYSRSPRTRARAVEMGAVDRAAESLEGAAEGATLVILATPILAMEEALARLGRALAPGTLVTDVASTKEQVMKWAQASLPPTMPFIGGHPMAGKETPGIDAADADLFRGCVYCLTPSPRASPQAVARLARLVEGLGARPLFLEAALHDQMVAGISHLPLLASCALASAAAKSPLWPQMAPLAASGFRDATRLASGSPEMSRDICLTNRGPILAWLEEYLRELEAYRDLVRAGDEGLELAFRRARQARQAWLEGRIAQEG